MAEIESPDYWSDAKQVDVQSPDYWQDAQVMDAPANTVFDQSKGRTVAMPQTLNATETDFVIKRDVDEVKNFFAMEDVGGFTALGNGIKSFFVSQPQVVGAFGKELYEKSIADVQANPEKYKEYSKAVSDMEALPLVGGMFTWARQLGEKANEKFGNDEQMLAKSEALIERNKKYMADAGLERPEQGGVAGVMYDLGQGGGSLFTSLAIAALTRSPKTAGLYFSALQKASVYQEARAAGKSPEEAGDISDVAGLVEGGLEMIGLDLFTKALKGNSAVKRFVSGFTIEAVQEASQATGEEAITQGTGIRQKDLAKTIEDILYQGFLGGVLGGSSNVAVGAFVKEEAQKRGMDEKTAAELGAYAEKNFDKATKNLTEFIDKELAPIAKDEKSAMEFMTLMQKFGNNQDLVQREQLDPETRAVFDQYIEMFNASVTDKGGIQDVEKSFYDMAVKAGVAEDEAVTASKLVGARADAASRALGISPMQWLESKKLSIQVEGKESPEIKEAQEIKNTLAQKQEKRINRNDAYSVQKGLGLSDRPLSVLQYIKKLGGIHIGLTNEEQNNVKQARAQKGMSASKYAMASGELRRIFENKKAVLGGLINDRGLGLDELHRSLVNAGYLEKQETAQDESNPDEVLDLIEREANGTKVYQLEIDRQIDAVSEGEMTNSEFYDYLGITSDMSVQEIAGILERYRQEGVNKAGADTLAQEDDILFQSAKGTATFSKEGILIQLFKGSDASTLLHELGHMFLRDMRDVAKTTKRPMVKKDYEAVKKFLGATGDTLTVAQEEKFARAFEAYLREGRAPKPELQTVFDKFKQWLTDIYKSVKELNVQINPEIRKTFDRMLGSDYAMAEKLNQQAQSQALVDDYEANRSLMKNQKTLGDDTRNVFGSLGEWASDALVPISTRLDKINSGLKHAVRRFLFDSGLHTHEDKMKVKPFIEKVSEISDDDYFDLDFALKNRDTEKVQEIIDRNNLNAEWDTVRSVLDELYVDAENVGLDMNYIEEYFPRKVKADQAGLFMAEMRRQDYWSEIEHALEEANLENATREEQADFVNQFLRGFISSRLNLAKPSFTKERAVDYIKPEWNKYYEDSMPTLIQYIAGMRHGIESRKLFGKSSEEVENNIGDYVNRLVEQGLVQHKEEVELKKLLKAVVEQSGTRGWVGWVKNATYIYTMGNPISAITQIQDLAFSLYENGLWRTGIALKNSLTGNQLLKKEDLGIDNVLQEFEDETRAAKFVRLTFKAVGLSFMDNVGKETFIDATFQRLQSQANKGNAELKETVRLVFGDKADTVMQDIKDGNLTEDVKYLLFSELSDVQPISIAEMPRFYAVGGNWRIMYMLKSYTVRQIDIFRREAFNDILSGNKARTATGLRRLTALAICLAIMGMGTDALKNLILGREYEVSDMLMDNMLKLMGFSKYTIYKAKTEGYGAAAIQTITPPILSPINDLRDLDDIVVGKVDKRSGKTKKKPVKDMEVLGHIPLGGKLYYWWYGGGRAKEEKKKKKTNTP